MPPKQQNKSPSTPAKRTSNTRTSSPTTASRRPPISTSRKGATLDNSNSDPVMMKKLWKAVGQGQATSAGNPAHITSAFLEKGHPGSQKIPSRTAVSSTSIASPTNISGRRLIMSLATIVVAVIVLLWFTGAHQTAKDIWAAFRKSGSEAASTTDVTPPQPTSQISDAGGTTQQPQPTHQEEGWITWITKISSPARIANICRQITTVAEAQMFNTLLLICLVYVFLQTLCIPGTVVLNALIGTLLGVAIGVPLAVGLGTAGACCCFTLSSVAGTKLVESIDKKLLGGNGLPKIRVAVLKYKDELFVYLLFLRLTPVLPNWLVNLASPVVDVPLAPFAAATCFGITPQTYLAVRFGNLVRQLSSSSVDGASETSIVTPMDTALLVLIAITILIVHRLKKKFGKEEGTTAGKVE